MIKFRLLLFTLAILFLTPSFIACHSPAKKFRITGSAVGFADGTRIFLDNASSSEGVLDSTLVFDNKFQFSGALKESTLRVLIRTKDFSDYKFLWLENGAMHFKAEKGRFRTALFTGSETQNLQNQLDSAIKVSGDEKKQNIRFIETHPSSIISASILDTYGSTWGRDTTVLLFKKLSSQLKRTSYGKNISEFVTLNKNLKVGDPAADFSQQNMSGQTIKLSDFKGKLVLLEFWGSWCIPCRKGNPKLVSIYNEFKPKGFEILGVASDSNKKEWMDAVAQDHLSWENVSDLRGDKNSAALIYGIYYYPANYLIDKKGIIIARDLKGDQLKKRLKQLL